MEKNRSTGKDDCHQDTFSSQVRDKKQKFLLHYNTHRMETFLQKCDRIMQDLQISQRAVWRN